MKMIKRIFSFLMLIFISFSLVSCDSFSKENDQEFLKISAFEFKEIDGVNYLVISYMDEEKEDTLVPLPEEQGTTNSITGISYKSSDDGKKTIVTVKFSDGTSDDFEVPNGVSVTSISYETIAGVAKMIVNYSDGSKDELPVIKGEDGIGIDKIEADDTDPTGKVKITFYYTNGNTYEVTLPAPKEGEKGKGISSMSVLDDVENNVYKMTVVYSDGSVQNFPLAKPAVVAWHLVNGKPADGFGKHGDFAFDQGNSKIYLNTNGIWDTVANLATSINRYQIEFNLNAPNDATAKLPVGYNIIHYANEGTYFWSSENLNPIAGVPEPTRDGYTFVGWYREPGDLSPTDGKFTDLTPVFGNLYLYAHWEANS